MKRAIVISLFFGLLFICGCHKNPTPTAPSVNLTEYYTDENQTTSWDNETACAITLNGTSVSIGGAGAYGNGTDVILNQPGTYVVSGVASNLRLVVDCTTAGTVRIVLNNADITSTSSSPIYIKECEKTILTLADGSSNILTDAAAYFYDDAEKQEPSACIFSKDDLYINGNGSLSVHANFNDAIQSKDDLIMLGGNITIISADDGLIGKDLVLISGGALTITAKGDGIKATNDKSTEVGIVMIEDGVFNIQTSAKGVKAITGIVITNGTFHIDTTDDAIHANGTIEINGGDFTIASDDDGIHADTALTISDCNMTITKSYEGLEAANITISGGTIDITSSDDGVNAADGQNHFTNTNNFIKIDGGKITINANGDGVDSNGTIYMTNGEVYIMGPSNNGNGAIDYDRDFEINGGILVAAGSTGMAQAPSSGSQYSISATFSKKQPINSEIKLLDNEGNIIISFISPKEFQNVVISCPKLEKGKTYSISANETAGSCTISNLVSYIGSNGGNGPGFGGHRQPPRF